MNDSASLVLSTLTRLCSTSSHYIPSLDLDSDDSLLEWATSTNSLLNEIDKNTNKAQQTQQSITNPDKCLVDFINKFSSHLQIRGFSEISSLFETTTTSNMNAGNQAEGTENQKTQQQQQQILPRGAATLLRHGNDVARIANIAQRLGEEVASLQQAKLRMQKSHSNELAQQAESFRGVISNLLEQQMQLERLLDEERRGKNTATNITTTNISSPSNSKTSPNKNKEPSSPLANVSFTSHTALTPPLSSLTPPTHTHSSSSPSSAAIFSSSSNSSGSKQQNTRSVQFL